MKHIHIFTGIVFVLLAGTLFLAYRTELSYDTFSFFGIQTPSSSPTTKYIAGISRPETWPPAGVAFLVGISFVIARNMATAIIGVVLASLTLLYMGFMAFLLTFELNFFGTSRNPNLGIGYFAGLILVCGFFTLMIVHLSKTLRSGRKKALREDVLDA